MACFLIISALQYLLLCSSLAQASALFVLNEPFYVNSSQSRLWYNNGSFNMFSNITIDQSNIRAVLSRQIKPVGFVCGFYCIGSCKYYQFMVAIVGPDQRVVVWSANRDRPVQENATLELTSQGDMILKDADGTKVWSTNTSGMSVQGMNLTQEGNLIVFNNEAGVVWQSFDHPTNLLLRGQRLRDGQKIYADSSKTNGSSGSYFATLTSTTGFAAYITVQQGQPQMYYRLPLDQSIINSKGPNYAELEKGVFVVHSGKSKVSVSTNDPDSVDIEYVKLESDGNLFIYGISYVDNWVIPHIIDMIVDYLGVCQHPRICGPYGVCKEGQCSCPMDTDEIQYFKHITPQLPNRGCSRITPLSCPPSPHRQLLVQVRNVTYFNIIDPAAASTNITDLKGCRQACMRNCSCGALIFKYDDNHSKGGQCYIPSEVFSFRDEPIPSYNFTSLTYIKVQIPSENPPTSASPTFWNRKNLIWIITGSSAGAFFVAAIVIVIFIRIMRHKEGGGEDPNMVQYPGSLVRFSYEELRVATEDFLEMLGAGGFGTVFKGKLADGTSVAVKRLDRESQVMREFLAELESIGNINHFNITRLVGFCADRSHKLLVYEYMSNGSLDKWIYHRGERPCLDWTTRKKIIIDIANGLGYLQEDCRQHIAHLDIKPQNILLDENFNAKISDFGLSRLIERDENTVNTNMRGTPGYMAPEWRQLRITVKVDTYSFGIVILEIVSGRKIFDQNRSESSCNLLWMLEEKAENGSLTDILDNMETDMLENIEEVTRIVKVAAWCLQDDYKRRPSMSTLMKVIEGTMEVDQDLEYRFTHSAPNSTALGGHVSAPPEASVLSNPR